MVKVGRITLVVVLFVGMLSAHAQSIIKQSEELGQVRWYRDYDKALALAKKEQKDVLILFQEVPGCATCRNYGQNVLSNPLMVEGIENLFVPLAIFNNKGGKDKIILDKYNEPSWNNPVVRIVNYKGEDVVRRISSDYSGKTLHKRMLEALASYGTEVPDYFNLLGQELGANGKTREQYFKMYCFWTGEKQLGKLDGVLDTESGFMNGEVVKVTYDASVLDKKELESYAKSNSFRPVDPTGNYRPANSDIHYYLRHTDYRYVPLTTLQQTKINSAIGSGKTGDEYLSPKQREWFVGIIKGRVKKNKNLLNASFADGWNYMQKQSQIILSSN